LGVGVDTEISFSGTFCSTATSGVIATVST